MRNGVVKKLGYLLWGVSLIINQQVYATQPGCTWQGEEVKLGDSIWVEDPVIVANSKNELKQKGYDDATIQKTIEHCDWCGFRVECVAEIALNENATQAGDIVSQVKGVMVLNRYSRDFYSHLKSQ